MIIKINLKLYKQLINVEHHLNLHIIRNAILNIQ